MAFKIKPEFANTVIGFNNSGLPLGHRNDLHILHGAAKASKDKSILNMFEEATELPDAEKQKLFEEKQDGKAKTRTNN